MDYLREFNKLLQEVDYSKSISQKFNDFLTMTAYSIAQPFYRSDEFEDKYLDVAKNYKKEQHNNFSEMFTIVIDALEVPQDFLGQIFSTNAMGASYTGQFFTPYHVSKLMAEILNVDVKEKLKHKNFITLSEPCVGSGGMVIAFAQTMQEQGLNYQDKLYVEAVDIDDICYKMAYIQLSLLGIPAKVIKGDSLNLKFQEVLYTPMFFINSFDYKLKLMQDELVAGQKINKEAEFADKIIEITEVKKESFIEEIRLKDIQLRLF
ncbi:MAG: N-6 DNA methylase [Candidatus Gastranaerophilales bacterium]|nr:N-6 DNA methylase [Candidatus Gastranaerophilales bacterium]